MLSCVIMGGVQRVLDSKGQRSVGLMSIWRRKCYFIRVMIIGSIFGLWECCCMSLLMDALRLGEIQLTK